MAFRLDASLVSELFDVECCLHFVLLNVKLSLGSEFEIRSSFEWQTVLFPNLLFSLLGLSVIDCTYPHLSHCKSFFMINQFFCLTGVLSHCSNVFDTFNFLSSHWNFWFRFDVCNDACEHVGLHLLSPLLLLNETSSKLLYWCRRSNSTVPCDF